MRMLLGALFALAIGIGARTTGTPAADGSPSREGAPGALAPRSFETRAPFLAGSATSLVAALELATRTVETVRLRTSCNRRDDAPCAANRAALRLRTAQREHADVVHMLTVVRAGRIEVRSTPPPVSVS
jgi:hypothetical protein